MGICVSTKIQPGPSYGNTIQAIKTNKLKPNKIDEKTVKKILIINSCDTSRESSSNIFGMEENIDIY